MPIAQRGRDGFAIQAARAFQNPKRVLPRQMAFAVLGRLAQLRGGLRVCPLHQQPMRGGAQPTIVRFQVRDELAGILPGNFWGLFWFLARVYHAINPAQPNRRIEFAFDDLFAQERSHIMFVLQNAAVHVHDVQATIGAVDHIHGAKPLVGGSQPLGFIVCVSRIGHSVRLPRDALATNHIAARLRDKRVAHHRGGILVAAINHRPARRRPRGQMAVAQHRFLVAAIDARIHTGRPHRALIKERHIHPVPRRMMRIAHGIMTGNKIAVQWIGIVVKINAPVIILRDSPLAARAGVVNHPFAINEAQAFAGFRIVKPVVEAGHQAILGVLHRALGRVVF